MAPPVPSVGREEGTMLLPLYDKQLQAIVEPSGVVQWRYDSTPAARLCGRPRAERIYKAVISNKSCYGLTMLLWCLVGATVVLVVILGVFFVVPPQAMVASSVVAWILVTFLVSHFLDFRIVGVVVRTGHFWANFLLATIGFLSLGFIWNFDFRFSAVPLYLYLVIICSMLDAVPPKFRLIIGLPILFGLVGILLLGIILILFDRLPNINSTAAFELGTFDGLAARPVVISPQQLLLDAGVGHLIFLLRIIYQIIATRKRHELYLVHASILNTDDDTFDPLHAIPLPFARRPTRVDTHQQLTSPEIVTADNPEFRT